MTEFIIIAHALGGVDGRSHTNSLEAFHSSYERGCRYFEADLTLTTDGEVVARHDWSDSWQPGLQPEKRNRRLDLETYKSHLVLDQYQPVAWSDLLALLSTFDDWTLIVDCKETDPDAIRHLFARLRDQTIMLDRDLLQRIVPELFSLEMENIVQYVYRFERSIFSLYRSRQSSASLIRYLKGRSYWSIAMPVKKLFSSPALLFSLRRQNKSILVHTVNFRWIAWIFRFLGIRGVYSDKISPYRSTSK